ncbi:transmembrane protein [Ceratobasidium sp. AG-Ba]|nr:transmembrane protein [Ceratobasidium sp. AG-Ba]
MGFYSGAQAVSPGALVVSDNDVSITYFGDWSVIYSAPRSAIYFQDTMHTTKTAGDYCTFTFAGTAVWYFTDFFPGNAAVDISIDGGPAEPVLTASAGGAGLTQRIAWSMVDLSDGPHTVRITHAGDGNYASVDFFMYLPRLVMIIYGGPNTK